MIYIKIQKDVYNNLTLDKFIKDYPSYARRYLALHRIIWHTLQKELKDYPDIDIVISDKKQNNVLGRLFLNKIQGHKEYKFIPQKTGNPYIVLYPDHILRYFYNHKVKGFKEVFLHEFLHFRQWLLSKSLGHNKDIKATDDNLKLNDNLKTFTEILNNKRD